jgi:hypothetical protein
LLGVVSGTINNLMGLNPAQPVEKLCRSKAKAGKGVDWVLLGGMPARDA